MIISLVITLEGAQKNTLAGPGFRPTPIPKKARDNNNINNINPIKPQFSPSKSDLSPLKSSFKSISPTKHDNNIEEIEHPVPSSPIQKAVYNSSFRRQNKIRVKKISKRSILKASVKYVLTLIAVFVILLLIYLIV